MIVVPGSFCPDKRVFQIIVVIVMQLKIYETFQTKPTRDGEVLQIVYETSVVLVSRLLYRRSRVSPVIMQYHGQRFIIVIFPQFFNNILQRNLCLLPFKSYIIGCFFSSKKKNNMKFVYEFRMSESLRFGLKHYT